MPCFATAVAAAVAATKADEAGGPIQHSGFETPREHQSHEISSKPLMLPGVGNTPLLGSCEYFTPRSVKPNFNGALNDGFFTPRDGATQCATPETPRMNPHSPEWTSCASRRDAQGFEKGLHNLIRQHRHDMLLGVCPLFFFEVVHHHLPAQMVGLTS